MHEVIRIIIVFISVLNPSCDGNKLFWFGKLVFNDFLSKRARSILPPAPPPKKKVDNLATSPLDFSLGEKLRWGVFQTPSES